MSSEHERIERLSAIYAGDSPALRVGIGDDCAVLAPTERDEVWTIDVAVEGTHFRRELMPLQAIGYRAFMAAASDIAAMGARARAALSSLVLPATLSDAELEALCGGTARAARELGIVVAGGNLSRGGELSITTTVLGEAHRSAVKRSGARVGDGVFVTGPIGTSALGLTCLLTEDQTSEASTFVQGFLWPRARLDLAERIAEHASSAIDISDGLIQDAEHIANSSNCTLVLRLHAVPRLRDFAQLAQRHEAHWQSLMLTGGEDYEVLFTADTSAVVGDWATCIGEVRSGEPSVQVVGAAGHPIEIFGRGFDHFR